ncbi:hypothetical protein ACFRQM_26135 [Streptomyces sp. NPDC056831]|uniref:hypothetical protein n=1 Tax=Streptomyces sp. NPDC056831 TaxID=3345954 RepID=UPI0036A71416
MRFDDGVGDDDEYARTSNRLTGCGCLAGLAIAVLGIPLWIFFRLLFCDFH